MDQNVENDRVAQGATPVGWPAFGVEAARAYGRVFAAVAHLGRKPRGARAVDLLIAAVAVAEGLPLYTRNPDDFAVHQTLLGWATTRHPFG
jgi:predicted nucleic acid-binding protein